MNVTVTNNAGHKFPTGFPSRQAWLHVTVTDAEGTLAFESGAPQADGTISGNDADADANAFEPHYDEITSADEVQIYQSIMADSDEQITQTLLRALSYPKDNRLLPDGFDKTTAEDSFAVHGNAEEDNDFVGGGDEVGYVIDTTGFAGPFTVTAELLYQSVSFRFANDLRSDSGDEIDTFLSMFDAADLTPVVVDLATTTVGG
jgi:hypothetical protein